MDNFLKKIEVWKIGFANTEKGEKTFFKKSYYEYVNRWVFCENDLLRKSYLTLQKNNRKKNRKSFR